MALPRTTFWIKTRASQWGDRRCGRTIDAWLRSGVFVGSEGTWVSPQALKSLKTAQINLCPPGGLYQCWAAGAAVSEHHRCWDYSSWYGEMMDNLSINAVEDIVATIVRDAEAILLKLK